MVGATANEIASRRVVEMWSKLQLEFGHLDITLLISVSENDEVNVVKE